MKTIEIEIKITDKEYEQLTKIAKAMNEFNATINLKDDMVNIVDATNVVVKSGLQVNTRLYKIE